MESLQFDRAELPTPAQAPTCAACAVPIAGVYYALADKTFCEPCRQAVGAAVTGGSGFERFVRAAGVGTLAAIAGAGIWFGVVAWTGYEFSLVAILVGFLVGKGVRWGAERRGGWPYQSLAIVLTYFAISATYLPPYLDGAKGIVTGIGVVVVALIAVVVGPILAGIESPMGFLILGIGLFEAWQLNRRLKLDFRGPFTVSAAATVPPPTA